MGRAKPFKRRLGGDRKGVQQEPRGAGVEPPAGGGGDGGEDIIKSKDRQRWAPLELKMDNLGHIQRPFQTMAHDE